VTHVWVVFRDALRRTTPGVDARLVRYACSSGEWVYATARRPHSLDVRALEPVALSDDEVAVVSAGLDALVCSTACDATGLARPVRHWPFPYHRAVTCTTRAGTTATSPSMVVGVMHADRLEVFRAGTTSSSEGGVVTNWRHALRVEADAPRNLQCVDVASSGDDVITAALCDGACTRVVEFVVLAQDVPPRLRRRSPRLPRAHAVSLFFRRHDDHVSSLALSDATVDRLLVYDAGWVAPVASVALAQPACSLLAVAPCSGGGIALAAPGGHLVLVPSAEGDDALEGRPVKRVAGVRALTWLSADVAVAATDAGFALHSSEKNDDAELERVVAAATAAAKRRRLLGSIVGLAADVAPERRPGFLAFTHSGLLVAGSADHDTQGEAAPAVVSTRYQPLLGAAFVETAPAGGADLLVVENPWIRVATAQHLRPLKRRRFGLAS